jgi:hypothetical protein
MMVVAGCSFDPTGIGGDDVTPGDDAPPADAFVCVSWESPNVADPCDPALGEPVPLALDGGTFFIDTATGMLGTPTPEDDPIQLPGALIEQEGGVDARVVNLSSLSIASDATLGVYGDAPLILVVHGDVQVDGAIDAAAYADLDVRRPGPGGNSPVCGGGNGDPGQPTESITAGGGGGGGGGYGDDGGDGSDGNGGGHGNKGGKGGKNGAATLEPLRGGCAGGEGGSGAVDSTAKGGAGGDGGGAVEITALGDVTIAGELRAGGTGGAAEAAGFQGGGGGGGSGGALLIDGAVVAVLGTAAICANGGGGGEGAQVLETSQGGGAGTCTELPAPGGGIEPSGGDGGDGGALADGAGAMAGPASDGAGGGGGGGSVGRIRIQGREELGIREGAVISPQSTN